MSEKRRSRSAKRRRRKGLIKSLIILAILILLVAVGYYGIKCCQIKKVQVTGNVTYTPGEVESQIRKYEFVPNTLVMVAHNRLFHLTYLPFVEEMEMSMNPRKPDVLKVRIKEKKRAGVFEYMSKFFYFNEDGYTMESRSTLFEDVPIVTGVKFKAVQPEERLKTEGDYVDSIVGIVRAIREYKIQVSEIIFESEKDVTLHCGSFDVYLGSTDYLDGKMSRLPAVLEAISKEHDGGTIDLHRCTEDKDYITFREND